MHSMLIYLLDISSSEWVLENLGNKVGQSLIKMNQEGTTKDMEFVCMPFNDVDEAFVEHCGARNNTFS